MSKTKTCSRCGHAKSLDEFKTDQRKPDGKASSCKACNAAPKVGDIQIPPSRALVPVFDAQDPKAWVTRISERWRDSIEAIFDVGRMLNDAKAALPHGAFGQMIENDLPFSANTAQRLMAIARDGRLSNPAHAQLLPASWTTLYELTKLSDAEFESAIAQQIIRPDMIRGEAELIRPLARAPRIARPMSDDEVLGSDGGVESGHAGREGQPVGLTHTRADLAGAAPGPSETTPLPNGHRAIAPSRAEPTDSADFFPTPPWATRALLEHVFPHLERRGHCKFQKAWEPACGAGHMAETLKEYFPRVLASDIHDYDGYSPNRIDFLKTQQQVAVDWIITNPPFGEKAEAFVLRALDLAGTGVGMFMRLQWLESAGRYERIFKPRPPTCIAIFSERVPLHKGRWEQEGSTATAYIWLVWIKGATPQAPFWIPPGCRERLTRPEDRRFAVSEAAA